MTQAERMEKLFQTKEYCEEGKEIIDRYDRLIKVSLARKYDEYFQYCLTGPEILEVNAWYQKVKDYLGKRFVREFISFTRRWESIYA